ncbi:MAG: hypothetical protein AB1Z98_33235 [Nannocystaceae bacterium]
MSTEAQGHATSFRERVAWLSIFAILGTLGPYLAWASVYPPTVPMPDLSTLSWFGVAVVAQAVVLGGGQIWMRLRWPEDACAPADERDRAIERRSVRIAYYTLIVGMVLVGCVMPFSASGWALINAAVFAIVVAELAHYGIAVWCYRHGWND